MAVNNLSDLYIHELKDLYSADKQALTITKRLSKAASNKKLSDALDKGVKGIEDGMQKIEAICEKHGKKATGKTCKGMKGLVDEVKAHVFEEDFGDKDTKDAAIIAQYQRLSHYAIAGYGTAQAFAKALGHKADVTKLEKCLDGCYDGDKQMSKLAENSVNSEAVS